MSFTGLNFWLLFPLWVTFSYVGLDGTRITIKSIVKKYNAMAETWNFKNNFATFVVTL